ncbi:coiled-coil domain-containing protein 1-like [Sycon ciliatum]|uniref:coiled-coil domain-containing protein 1-like n=1 Tax=Sycon ciliatum TaxID=27933 RepID=UPI0031F71BB3
MQFGDEVDGYDAEDLGDEDSLMGDIDQMDDLEELQSIYDDYMDEEGDIEQNFAHKDATDEEYLKSLQDTNFDESMDGVDKDADGKYDMSDFLGDDGDDGEREQDEVQDSVLDQYAIHNDDAMDFMSDADQEYNERSEPVVAEEQLRNDNVMPNYSPKNF